MAGLLKLLYGVVVFGFLRDSIEYFKSQLRTKHSAAPVIADQHYHPSPIGRVGVHVDPGCPRAHHLPQAPITLSEGLLYGSLPPRV